MSDRDRWLRPLVVDGRCDGSAFTQREPGFRPASAPGEIEVSAVVVSDSRDQILTVRKSGTDQFMFPGGKPEVGEHPRETAVRECREEINIIIDPGALAFLGIFEAPAANETGFRVRAHTYWIQLVGSAGRSLAASGEQAGGKFGAGDDSLRAQREVSEAGVQAGAEIAEIRWVNPLGITTNAEWAPLLAEQVLPWLCAGRVCGLQNQ